MSNLWVAVTAEYNGSVFSHRATGGDYLIGEKNAVHHYNVLLDSAGGIVRRGLAGWLPPQELSPVTMRLSAHEKLREIEKIMEDPRLTDAVVTSRIRGVLQR
jgi:hypothetical protein